MNFPPSSARLAVVGLIGTAIFLLEPDCAEARWAVNKISDERFADVAASTALGRTPFALYGNTIQGFVSRSYTTFDKVGGARQVSIEQRQSGADGSDLFEMWEDSGAWKSRDLKFHVSFDGVGIAAIPGMSKLVLDYEYGPLIEIEFVPAELSRRSWHSSKKPGGKAQRWPRGSIQRLGSNKLLQSRSGQGTYMVNVSTTAWQSSLSVMPLTFDVAQELTVLAYGDARGDGNSRYYAMDNQLQTRVYEVEERRSGPWHVTQELPGIPGWQIVQLVLGDARGDKRQRLYTAGPRGLWEYEWDGTIFKPSEIKAKIAPLIGRTSGLVIGQFHSDELPRLYLVNGDRLIEYTHSSNGWRAASSTLGIGLLGSLVKVEPENLPPRLFVMGYDSGLYELSWKEESPIAVVPFIARGLPQEEGVAIADILRNRIVQNGECKVLERERMHEILAEHNLQQSSAVDVKTALPIGRLLKASSIIGGSLGKLDDQHIATVSILSVRTGAVQETAYKQWEDDSEFQDVIDELAKSACKSAESEK